MTYKKSTWNTASIAGLALGVIPMAVLYLNGIVGPVFSVLLWLVKFVACIILMRFFLKRFSEYNHDAERSDVFKFGMLIALMSALLYSAFNMAYMLFINPDVIQEALDTVLENYSSFMDSNARSEIEELIPRLPAISFFGNLIYCWLFGTVLSAIFSKDIISDNPFKNNSSELEDEK